MKNLIKGLAVMLMVFGVANCSKKSYNSAPSNKGIGGTANVIVIDGPGGSLEWSNTHSNFYINVTPNSNCLNNFSITGLSASADDSAVTERRAELEAILKSSKVLSGTNSNKSMDMSQFSKIIISGDDGTDTYYLVEDRSDIPTGTNTLSNSGDILDFYDDVYGEIQSNGKVSCLGK